MALKNIKIVFFVLGMVVICFLLLISQGTYQSGSKWKVFSEKIPSRGDDRLSDGLLHRKGNLPGSLSQTGNTDTTNYYSVRNTKTQRTTSETPIPMMNASSFDKLPQWSFEDIYNLDTLPRSTTCVQSLRNSKDETFQRAFLPNVRLFLHKDNFNIREWNRLSHFNHPFGYMEMKYDDIMPVLKLIPKPKEPLLLPKPGGDGCVRCAVVGTGGILNGSKTGAEIDAHDYVFRMNGAVIDGYEEDVGKRTSVYVHTAHSITTSPIILDKYGYKSAPNDEGIKYVLIPEGSRDFQWLEALFKGEKVSSGEYQGQEPRRYYSGQFSENRFYVLHQDFLRYVRNRFLNSSRLNEELWALFRPTNGAFTLFMALQTCDTVSAYGFMTEDYYKYSSYYVEKHQKSEVIFYANHDLNLEKDLWKSFHGKKILKLYQRTGSQEAEKQKDS